MQYSQPNRQRTGIASETIALLRILVLAVYGELPPAARAEVTARAESFIAEWTDWEPRP